MATPKQQSSLATTYIGARTTTGQIGVANGTFTVKDVSALLPGVASGQANSIYDNVGTLDVSDYKDLNLSNGTLKNSLSERIVMNGAKRIIIANFGTDSTLLVGGATTHPMFTGFLGASSSQIKIGPGGRMSWQVPGTAATIAHDSADRLRLTHAGDGAAPITYAIVVEGTDLYDSTPAVIGNPVSSLWDATAFPNGFGKKTVGGSFTAGVTLDPLVTAPQRPIAVVTTNISGGSGLLSLVVAGTDDTGSTSTTWSGVFVGNNPTAAATLSNGSSDVLAAQLLQLTQLTTTAGVVPGSVLIVAGGNTETIVVQEVPNTIYYSAFYAASHTANYTIAGNTSIVLIPSVAGRRMVSCSGITYTTNGHSGGVVQICGCPVFPHPTDRIGDDED